jgi:hypothetical protein
MKIKKSHLKEMIKDIIKEVIDEGDALDAVKEKEEQELEAVKEKFAVDKVRAREDDKE